MRSNNTNSNRSRKAVVWVTALVVATLVVTLNQDSKRYGSEVSRNSPRHHAITLYVGFDRDSRGKILDPDAYLFDFGLTYRQYPLRCHDQLKTEVRIYRAKGIDLADVRILLMSDPDVPVATNSRADGSLHAS